MKHMMATDELVEKWLTVSIDSNFSRVQSYGEP
jgi:hypothetical protein